MIAERVESAAPALGPVSVGQELSRPRNEARLVAALGVAGSAIGVLLGAFILLYTSLPAGYNVLYGLSLGSVALFRELWPYPTLTLDSRSFGWSAAVVIMLLWGFYLAAWALVGRCCISSRRAQMALVIAGFTVVFHISLALAMPPVLSSDIYHYALFGRMVSFYGLNPYAVPGTAISSDPFWGYAFWHDVTTHYGPVWTLISAGLTRLGGENVLTTILLFKGAAALFSLANCLLVFLLARRLTGGDGLGALLLYAWNPLILIETAGSGHNDAVMMTFALLGLLLAVRGRILFSLAALVLSVLVKYLSVLLLVFFVIRCLRSEPSWRRAAGLAARMAGVAGLLVIALFLPFWAGREGFERLATVGAPFQALPRVLLREWVVGLLADGRSLAEARAAAEPYVIAGLHIGFAGLVLFLARSAMIHKPDWPRVMNMWGLTSLVYVMVVYGWNLPWLLVPTLATTCVALQTRMSTRLLALAHGLGLLLMLPYTLLVALSS